MDNNRILIVDDEFLVRLGLKTTIDWQAHGYEIIGEAANVKEALDIIWKTPVDIVMTDIKMPGQDGLVLIEEARKIDPEIKFIILTNYGDFQIAKRAITLGVSHYLLKSEISGETLLKTLESVRKELHQSDSTVTNPIDERNQYLENCLAKAQINSCIPQQWLEAPVPGLFPDEPYVVIKYFCNISQLNQQSLDMVSKTMGSLVSTEFPAAYYCETIFKQHFYFTIIASMKNVADISKVYKERSNIIRKSLEYYFSVQLKGGVSETGAANDIPRLLEQAELTRQRVFFGEGPFLCYDENFQEALLQAEKPHVSNTSITKYITEDDQNGLNEYLKSIFTLLRTLQSYSIVRHAFFDFLSIAKSCQEKLHFHASEVLSNKVNYDSWDLLTSMDEAETYVKEVFDLLMEARNFKDTYYSMNVRKSINLIKKNYATNISLESVAQQLEISNSYLSTLFKQETGINFIAYLNQVRIEESKKLLTTTNMKIYEIAEMVGFASPYYFSKIFKEVTKMQCKVYRDTYASNETENDL